MRPEIVCSDSFLSLSSALTVLKQEIPSPFGSDQVKKAIKTPPLSKEHADDIDQVTSNAVIKNNVSGSATGTNANGNLTGAPNANAIACHLNGNSNSSTSNELLNCLDNVQPNSNDPNDERNDSKNLSTI